MRRATFPFPAPDDVGDPPLSSRAQSYHGSITASASGGPALHSFWCYPSATPLPHAEWDTHEPEDENDMDGFITVKPKWRRQRRSGRQRIREF